MFKVRFATDSAAFEENGPGHETALILEQLASRIRDRGPTWGLQRQTGPIMDSNGNKIGEWSQHSKYHSPHARGLEPLS
jgi:hypothetical protein